jgi:hypothetical protein
MRHYPTWSNEEDKLLAIKYPDLTNSQTILEQFFKRTWYAIKLRASKLNIKRYNPRNKTNKVCCKCNLLKDIKEFYSNKSRPDRHSSYCIKCQLNYYQNNKQRQHLRSTKYKKAYIQDWISFFKNHYGTPKCEVCGVALKWIGNKNTSVHFDHRNEGKETITIAPKQWIMRRPHNEETKLEWLSCQFGILCGTCNFRLPTDNRKEWLKNVENYIFNKSKEVIC